MAGAFLLARDAKEIVPPSLSLSLSLPRSLHLSLSLSLARSAVCTLNGALNQRFVGLERDGLMWL